MLRLVQQRRQVLDELPVKLLRAAEASEGCRTLEEAGGRAEAEREQLGIE